MGARGTKGVWDTYNGYIKERRDAGATLQQIGEETGVSRQRVHQILRQHYQTSEIPLLSTADLTQLTGFARHTILCYRRAGIIKPVNNNLKRPRYDASAVKAILSLRQACTICGNRIPNKRFRYCSKECAEIGKYEAWRRVMWRRLHKKTGQRIATADAYKDKRFYPVKEAQ